MKVIRGAIVAILMGTLIFAASATAYPVKVASVKPKGGFVPDEATAILIAKAVWYPIYGKQEVEKKSPFHATLAKGVWTMRGSLPAGELGGTAVAEIAKDNARILFVIHEE
ncbi:MAG: hypothetical protein HY077_02640 [Elusimicrobia bacterium]|nr:hypothetical protein [Elusimicrobiota bacterium]